MTNIRWGSLEPLDFLDLSISDILDLTITTRSSNYIAGDYRLTGEPSNRNEFFGSGFTFDAAGNPVDGTINSLVLTNGGQLIGRFDGFSVGVGQFINWAISGNDRAAQETILAGDDVISGSPFSDFVQGYGGRDVIILGTGDDIAFGGPGNDVFDGSVGIDTLILGAGLANYQLVVWAGIMGAIPRVGATLAADGIDKGVSVERLAFLTTGESVDTPA